MINHFDFAFYIRKYPITCEFSFKNTYLEGQKGNLEKKNIVGLKIFNIPNSFNKAHSNPFL